MNGQSRGSAVVSHVLAVGIASLLIVGLLYSAGTLLSDQRESSARQQMETVGNRLAAELTQLDRMSERGGNVSMSVRHQPLIAGESYNVRLRQGSDCEADGMDPDTCLVVTSAGHSITEYVPLQAENDLSVDSNGAGEFRLEGRPQGEAAPDAGRQSLRPGVGHDFTSTTRVSGGLNQEPVPRFTIDPGAPDSSNDILFDGSTSVDDSRIVNYTWSFGNGDRIGSSKPKITYDYDHDPGYYEVYLNVTDDDGATVKTSQNITVAGLEYNRDLTIASGNDETEFTMTNNWSSHPVTIESILIDPPNDVDELDCYGWLCEPEVTITSDTDSSVREIDDTEVPNDGIIVTGFDTTVQPGDDVTITVDDYGQDISGETMSFSVRHEVDGQSNVTRFTDVVGSMEIRNFYLEEDDTDLDAVLITDKPMDTVEVEWDRLFTFEDGTLTEADFSQDSSLTDASQDRYAYRAQVNDEWGLHYVVLREATSSGGIQSGETPIYRLEYVSTLYD
ncbi:DUF7266 family protein [Halorientalis halophila]|uniref:DUF7266 family protein n=1 Tax=Halorientalis halophila TaxID=3108499 RepID=UPI00300A5417